MRLEVDHYVLDGNQTGNQSQSALLEAVIKNVDGTESPVPRKPAPGQTDSAIDINTESIALGVGGRTNGRNVKD